jgi:SanA protein
MRPPRKASIVVAALLGLVATLHLPLVIAGTAQGERIVIGRVFSPVDAPARDVAIVLGARPGPLLDKRMDAACLLVEGRKVRRLLLSGMPEEMPAMRARAASCLGPDDILVDDGARRTLENLRRARDRFGARAPLVITQDFHMGRALYLADALGLEAVGVRAEGAPGGLGGHLREQFARVRALVDAHLLRSSR